VTIILGVWC